MKRRTQGFTLIEILVVLGIIMILAAVLFPVLNRQREKGYQTHCASNLKQIYFAVSQYHTDYKRYPGSLAFVVSESMTLPTYGSSPAAPNDKSKGYFKGGLDSLVCPDDDFETEDGQVRSSYGDISNGALSGGTLAGPDVLADPGRYVWNYWGYNESGWAHITAPPALSNYRLSNRFAPSSTIITHCVFHRMPTAGDLAGPNELYNDADDSRNARDIVVRLDGTAQSVDVSAWKNENKWVNQIK